MPITIDWLQCIDISMYMLTSSAGNIQSSTLTFFFFLQNCFVYPTGAVCYAQPKSSPCLQIDGLQNRTCIYFMKTSDEVVSKLKDQRA